MDRYWRCGHCTNKRILKCPETGRGSTSYPIRHLKNRHFIDLNADHQALPLQLTSFFGIVAGVDSSKGVLVTVMNYTGDVLNFGVAVEKAKARNPKMQIETLVVGDNVGVPRSRTGKVCRRGIAGTVFVHKITGEMAVAGFGLNEVKRVGILVSRSIVSIDVSLDRVHVPGQPIGDVSDRIPGAGEVELGM